MIRPTYYPEPRGGGGGSSDNIAKEYVLDFRDEKRNKIRKFKIKFNSETEGLDFEEIRIT